MMDNIVILALIVVLLMGVFAIWTTKTDSGKRFRLRIFGVEVNAEQDAAAQAIQRDVIQNLEDGEHNQAIAKKGVTSEQNLKGGKHNTARIE